MANHSLSRELAQEAVDEIAKQGGDLTKAAKTMGISRQTLQSRKDRADVMGVKPSGGLTDYTDVKDLQRQVKSLVTELAQAQKKSLTEDAIRRAIVNLRDSTAQADPPQWTLEPKGRPSSPGVPTLFLSDLHWGEVVKSSQINGVNKYSLSIAHDRIRMLAESAVGLLKIISPSMDYPGLVLPLGGDMISGNIHDELSTTNELNTMPTVVDLFAVLKWLIGSMADTFGKVFLPCVTGNHGRDTMKIWNKDRHATSFDWLLYTFLAKHFDDDKRITFQIPDGPDALYRIYDHTYLLTHGDQYRGGDGMIGCLGPILRGDHKKRSRNAQIDMEFDTQLMGHWHQYISHQRVIVNGSLKGYDEYAYNNNFGFEPPRQAMWLTHPKYHITYSMPIYVDRMRAAAKTQWVSFAK